MKKIAVVLLFFALGCNKASDNSFGYAGEAEADMVSESDENSSSKAEPDKDVNTLERKLIKTGNVEFESEDLTKTAEIIKTASTKYKANASNENEFKSDSRISRTITLRVPFDNFDALLSEISEGVDHFDRKSINVSDVTEEFLDVEARLKTKKELENRYIQLLSKAQKVSEILEIEREIASLRSDIESFEGRLTYLQNQVSLSTLTIDYYETISKDNRFWGKVKDGFGNGWDFLLQLILGIINIWPVWIIGFGLYWLVKRIRRK